jgi:hypothetical protein
VESNPPGFEPSGLVKNALWFPMMTRQAVAKLIEELRSKFLRATKKKVAENKKPGLCQVFVFIV